MCIYSTLNFSFMTILSKFFCIDKNATSCYNSIMDQDFYSIKEFASKLGVSPYTIRRAIKNGRISGFRAGSTDKSTYRIPHSELQRMGIIDLKKIIKNMIADGTYKDI